MDMRPPRRAGRAFSGKGVTTPLILTKIQYPQGGDQASRFLAYVFSFDLFEEFCLQNSPVVMRIVYRLSRWMELGRCCERRCSLVAEARALAIAQMITC